MYDNTGKLVTAGRPMIESMVCDKAAKLHRLSFYLVHLGFKITGRVIAIGIGNKMPFRSGGKQTKEKKKR